MPEMKKWTLLGRWGDNDQIYQEVIEGETLIDAMRMLRESLEDSGEPVEQLWVSGVFEGELKEVSGLDCVGRLVDVTKGAE